MDISYFRLCHLQYYLSCNVTWITIRTRERDCVLAISYPFRYIYKVWCGRDVVNTTILYNIITSWTPSTKWSTFLDTNFAYLMFFCGERNWTREMSKVQVFLCNHPYTPVSLPFSGNLCTEWVVNTPEKLCRKCPSTKDETTTTSFNILRVIIPEINCEEGPITEAVLQNRDVETLNYTVTSGPPTSQFEFAYRIWNRFYLLTTNHLQKHTALVVVEWGGTEQKNWWSTA